MVKMKKLFICITILLSIPIFASEFKGRCVSVVEGDIVMVMREGREIKIQLWGIDCPEIEQPFGKKAKEFTTSLILGKTVKVVTQDRWKFDLPQAKLYLDKTYINLEIVKVGLAWYHYWLAPYESDLDSAEKEAQEKKRGLWQTPFPVPPWNWRIGKRSGKVTDPGKDWVFIVRRDKRYHRYSCKYVRYNIIRTTVQGAKLMGFTPCEVCKPEKE